VTRFLVHRMQVVGARPGTIVRTHEGGLYELSDVNGRAWLANATRLDREDSNLPVPAEVLWEPEPEPIALPATPGTVIAIGDWWFVRLRPYKPGLEPAWELLPAPQDVEEKARRNGFPSQCIYSDEIVRGEIDQEGSFRVVAAPEETA
jgi:hypothetical protein